MISNSIPAMLAAEHRNTLVQQAEAYQLARQARDARRNADAHRHLRRPRAMWIRAIRTTDAGLISSGFSRLSERSRRQRFLTAKKELTAAELRYFTDVDHRDHEALVAVSRLTGKGFGVARYVRHWNDPDSADVAVTVADDWQGRGIGELLVRRLTERARCEGIRRFTVLVSADNGGARGLLRHAPGEVRLIGRDLDTLTYEIRLAPPTARRPRRFGWRPAGDPCASAA